MTDSPVDADQPVASHPADLQAFDAGVELLRQLRTAVSSVVIGQQAVIDQLLIALMCRGHCLLVGVPGLAKTLLVNTLASALQLSFRRIQFTPDLMPSDITGTDVLQDDPSTGRRTFEFQAGPLFTQILLADEINRTPPKTQAALLEAMQERRVTIGSRTYPMPEPFFVLATQNPIEQEGTYPLPEAQLDRFMFNIPVDYPSAADELQILKQTTGGDAVSLLPVLTGQQILELQAWVRGVPVADHVFVYARDLVRATRPQEPDASDFVKKYLAWGAGPRGGQSLILGAKARAVLEGRPHATTDDVRFVAGPVLRHRLLPTFEAATDGVSPDCVIQELLATVPNPMKPGADRPGRS